MSNSFSRLMRRCHLGATRMLGYALTMQDYKTWDAATYVWRKRLSQDECATLAWAALRSLDRDYLLDVIEEVLVGAGMPLPPLFNPMDEAVFWVGIASPEELRAYILATFNRLPPDVQAEFLAHVQKKAA